MRGRRARVVEEPVTTQRRVRQLTDEEVVDIWVQKLLVKRKELKMTPRQCGFVSLAEASQLCSIGTVGNTVTDLLTLQEQGDKRDLQDFLDKHMPHIIAFGFVVGIIALGIFVISKTMGGSV